jgi:hypothetical protein
LYPVEARHEQNLGIQGTIPLLPYVEIVMKGLKDDIASVAVLPEDVVGRALQLVPVTMPSNTAVTRCPDGHFATTTKPTTTLTCIFA